MRWIKKNIKAYLAHKYYIRAHGEIRTDAIYSINRAIKLEPDKSRIPEYLELKGHIQKRIGREDESSATFEEALLYIKQHPQFCSGPSFKVLLHRIEKELEASSFSA